MMTIVIVIVYHSYSFSYSYSYSYSYWYSHFYGDRLKRSSERTDYSIGALIMTYTMLGRSLLYLQYNGLQNPIRIIQAPILCNKDPAIRAPALYQLRSLCLNFNIVAAVKHSG